MYCVVQIGSRMLRLECGTTRRTLSCAFAPNARTAASAASSIRMRESSPGKSENRVAGHGAHRNRRLPARDQHLAPAKADYAAFEAGGGWPGAQYGEPIFAAVEGANIPAAGAIQALSAQGHRLVGTA